MESVEGVPDEDLSRIHGKLIAWGFIRVSVLSRKAVGYQLTNLGKQSAEGQLPTDGSSDLSNEAA